MLGWVLPMLGWVCHQCVRTLHELIPCTVTDAALLGNEMVILTVVMISKVKVEGGRRHFPIMENLIDLQCGVTTSSDMFGVDLLQLCKEQLCSIRHKISCPTVF